MGTKAEYEERRRQERARKESAQSSGDAQVMERVDRFLDSFERMAAALEKIAAK